MAKKDPKKEGPPAGGSSTGEPVKNRHQLIIQNISTEMKDSYLDYAMSVITARALPDVRDGLKPVHRRILYAMHDLGLTSSAKFRKSATVVGEVLGKYHPHGDVAVYDAMVKMAQIFSHRYPLVLGQGNFGSVDGDAPAAMRYTEAKMSRVAGELLHDIEKETVNWRPNYDSTRKEPVVLPASVPNVLLNGTLGIAVGMATNIPPHNLRELVGATIHLVENPDATMDDLLKFIQGPDFPTGGVAFNAKDIAHASSSGRGGVVVRGEAEIVENKTGHSQIIITSLPYRVNKAEFVTKIAELVKEKKLEGIRGLNDLSSRGEMRVAVDLKAGAQPQKVLNYIYKHTELESVFHYNMLALVDGVPQTLSIKAILEEFIKHRETVVKRRTQFDLTRAEERAHILTGLKKALDHIDEVVKLIKASKDTPTAHANLMKQFKFSDKQATAILEMRLQKLAGLERKAIEDELKEKLLLIAELRALLASIVKIRGVIKKELKETADKYGDERKTKIIKGGVKNLSMEDIIADEVNSVVLTSGGYIKRTNPTEYRRQKRGGVGVMDLNTKEEDFVTKFLTASTHSDVLFFTDKGKVFQVKMYELPEGKRATKGKSIMNYLSIDQGDTITSVLAMPKTMKAKDKFSLVMVTERGVIKKVSGGSFLDVRRSGIIAIKLKKDDKLVGAFFVEEGDDIILTTTKGQAIRFKEKLLREMGRGAGGVRGMRLAKNDSIVGADVVKKDAKDAELFVMTANGFGKKTPLKEYKVQGRGGSGVKTLKRTDKTGDLIGAKVVSSEFEEVVAMSRGSQVIRIELTQIPSLGRQTQGVRVMKFREKDTLATFVCL